MVFNLFFRLKAIANVAEALHMSVLEVNELLSEETINQFSVILSEIHEWQQRK